MFERVGRCKIRGASGLEGTAGVRRRVASNPIVSPPNKLSGPRVSSRDWSSGAVSPRRGLNVNSLIGVNEDVREAGLGPLVESKIPAEDRHGWLR